MTGIDVKVEQVENVPTGNKHPNTCPGCGSHFRDDELQATLWVCGHCGFHFRMPSRARIVLYRRPLELRAIDQTERLAEAELNTGLNDAIVVGSCTLDAHPLELAVMDFAFMGGSMGSAVGEKFVRACDSAVEERRPLLLVTASGGARMQEGILALMQLAKTVAAIDELHEARLPLL